MQWMSPAQLLTPHAPRRPAAPFPPAFAITAELTAHLPGMDREQVWALVDKAHQVCPYSNATRGNVDVKLKIA